jgi:hypothetical protein
LACGCRATERKVSTHSPGKALVVYEIRRHVFPTAPSPTTTHLIACILTGSCSHFQRARGTRARQGGGVVKRVSSAHNVRCEHNELANSARWERVHGRKECSSERRCRVSAKPIVEAVVRACPPSNPRPPPHLGLKVHCCLQPPLNHRMPPCRSLSLRSHAHIHTRVASSRHPHRAHPQQDGGSIAQQRRGLPSRNIPPPRARAEEGRCHPTRAMGKGVACEQVQPSEFQQLVCAWPGPTAGVSGGGARVRQHRVCMRLMSCV